MPTTKPRPTPMQLCAIDAAHYCGHKKSETFLKWVNSGYYPKKNELGFWYRPALDLAMQKLSDAANDPQANQPSAASSQRAAVKT